MKFPGAKYGLKMACGENPKRVYGNKGGPQTRMGNVAGYRTAWIEAEQYRRKWDKWNADHKGDPPARDLESRDARRGAARQHPRAQSLLSRRRDGADDRHLARVRLQDPRVPPRRRGVQDRRPAREGRHRRRGVGRLGRLQDGGARRRTRQHGAREPGRRARDRPLRRSVGIAATQSGSGEGHGGGKELGIDISEDQAIKWLTINPAWALDLDSKIGSIETGQGCGRRALVGRSVQRVHARGESVDRRRAALRSRRSRTEQWRTDFDLGFVPLAGGAPSESTTR